MWNLKRLPSNVLFKVNSLFEENVRMASKKAIIEEKPPKPPKRGFFRRSESVTPDHFNKNTLDASNSDAKSNDSDNRRVMRRSSMICSEGFDKYTFDCHKRDIPSRSIAQEFDALPQPQEKVQNQNFVSENEVYPNARSSKAVTVEQQSAVRKISIPFKPLSAISLSNKNAPQAFKRVPEETIPDNVPLSYKRVPEETIPGVKNSFINTASNKSPVTTIPLSFNPDPSESNWNTNKSALKASPVKSAPVKNSPFSFKQAPQELASLNDPFPFPFNSVSQESAHVRNVSAPPSRQISQESASVRNVMASPRQVLQESPLTRNVSASPRQNLQETVPARNVSPSPLRSVWQESAPTRNVSPSPLRPGLQESTTRNVSPSPLRPGLQESTTRNVSPSSMRPVLQESSSRNVSPTSLKSASNEPIPIKNVPPSSFKQVSQESSPARNIPPSPSKQVSQESAPTRNAPLSFKHIPEKSRQVNKAISFRSISDYSGAIRNSPLLLKNVSDDVTPSRSAPLSLRRSSEQHMSNNYVPEEPMPVRNSPLSLKFGESVSLRNIPSSLQFSNEPSIPTRNVPSSLQTVPEEPSQLKESLNEPALSYKDVPDEPIPFRNAPLSLKPIMSKHISLIKKKTSFKGPIIKRDSVVHPGRIDMQGSLFIDGRFQNPWPTWKPPTFTNVLKFGITRNKSKVPPRQELDLILPIVKQNFSKLSIPEDGIRVTWIGHSTVLIQMHGLNILTDPMFSDRASPSQVVGPKRYRDPPCTIHDLPHINAVVISHSHYDHLDHNTVTLLNARFGSDIRWFVPLGLQVWMEQVGCENVVELDWWEENCVPEHSDIFFVFTPAQHWSKRALGDDNKVLWGSWCILGPKYKFFFAGDTGYCEVFKQIGRVHGPFDLCAIPIGAYEPRWFMKYQHVNPEEAVKIHMDVKSKRSLAIHWGTFTLANEYYLDPPVKLRESLDKNEIPPELFFTLKHGESRLIAQNNLVKKNTLSERNMKNS